MKSKLLIATTNVGKLKEISNFLKDLPLEIISLSEIGITDDVKEIGKTYRENSELKALFYAKKSNLPAIADDGGLEISALGGAPGLKSRRWLGHDASDDELINYLKKVSNSLPEDNRRASFRAVISFALPSGKVFSAEGEVKGIIAKEPQLKKNKGFPYRVFFYLPQIQKYYQDEELSEKEQKLYNHRYRAISKLKPIIKKVLMIND